MQKSIYYKKKNFKDFILFKYICQIYILADIYLIVENQALYMY